jgi:hypothetical protein
MKLLTKLVGSNISADGVLRILESLQRSAASGSSASSCTGQEPPAVSSSSEDVVPQAGPAQIQAPQELAGSPKLKLHSGSVQLGCATSEVRRAGFEAPHSPVSMSPTFSTGVPPGSQATEGRVRAPGHGATMQGSSTVSWGAQQVPKSLLTPQGSGSSVQALAGGAAVRQESGSGIYDPPQKIAAGQDVTRKFPKGIGHFWYDFWACT